MADSIRASLPPIYKHLFNEFFDRPKVVETRATCEKCSMCDQGVASPVAMDFFNPDTKCCTYWPMLPNYLVGAILADDSPEMAEGRRRVQAQIKSRIGVTPYHVNRPKKWTVLMTAYNESFGRAGSLLCPYYDANNPAGTCSIWRHREVICMTYYCKYSGGKRGYDYWVALKDYLGYTQRTLIRAATKAVDPQVIEPQFAKDSMTLEEMEDLPPKDSDYAAWWGKWVGREEQFYLNCHEWMKQVKVETFAKNVDETEEGKKILEALIAKYDLLENKILPKNLVRNARMKEAHVGDKVVVTSYHRFDSFSLDKDLYEVVGMFKADQTVEENLQRLQKEEGIELAPDLIEFLVAAGVLVEPAKPKAAAGTPETPAEATAELRGRRAALYAILDARGLEFKDQAKTKIEAADKNQLEAWIRKAAIAQTVDDVVEG